MDIYKVMDNMLEALEHYGTTSHHDALKVYEHIKRTLNGCRGLEIITAEEYEILLDELNYQYEQIEF